MLKQCLVIVLIVNTSFCSVLDWLGFKSGASVSSIGKLSSVKVPFEELDPEEKFLTEASKITGLKLDTLDICQQKLIIKLKSSCGSLNDEQLSKLAVGLLNCQSAIEGRKVYPCTQEMPLKECTRDMDPDTWNSYHVISNRARAVCYAARQDQFRALAEMTVNKLMTAAQEHIHNMATVEEKQTEFSQSLKSFFNDIAKSQTNILSSYGSVKKLEISLVSMILHGVDKLQDQKIMLSDFQQIMVTILEKFQDDMRNLNITLSDNMKRYAELHELLSTNLMELNSASLNIVDKLRESVVILQEREDSLLAKTDVVLQKLDKMNVSITNIIEWVTYLERIGQPRYHWMKEVAGDKGERLDVLTTAGVHGVSLLVAMAFCSFLSLPITSRWALLLTAPLNLYLGTSAEFNASTYLNLHTYYLSFILVVLGDYICRFIFKWFNKVNKAPSKTLSSENTWHIENKIPRDRTTGIVAAPVTNHTIGGKMNSKVEAWLAERDSASRNNGYLNGPLLAATIDTEAELNENMDASRETASISNSLTSQKSRCSAICKSGTVCKNSAYGGSASTRCRIHGRGSSGYR